LIQRKKFILQKLIGLLRQPMDSSDAVTFRGVAPFGMQGFERLTKVLKGRPLKAQGEAKRNPVK
jgi:hypothetical protein